MKNLLFMFLLLTTIACQATPSKIAAQESNAQIRQRAAAAYHKYQKCGMKAALNLFATG